MVPQPEGSKQLIAAPANGHNLVSVPSISQPYTLWHKDHCSYYTPPPRSTAVPLEDARGQLKCDDTRAETRFRLSAKRTSSFKSAGASVQSTIGSRGVRISCSNAGYTMLRGSVKSTDYPLHSPVSPSLPHPCVTVSHHISTGLYPLVLLLLRSHLPSLLNITIIWSICKNSKILPKVQHSMRFEAFYMQQILLRRNPLHI
jgi:hypothetical protein